MPSPARISPLVEALLFWAFAFLLLVGCSLFFGQGSITKLVVTLSFFLLPRVASTFCTSTLGHVQRVDFGLHFGSWKKELRFFFLLFLPILILYPLLHVAWLELQHHLAFLPFAQLQNTPIEWTFNLQFPLPPQAPFPSLFSLFPQWGWLWVIELTLDTYWVVALSEEYFYRGYLQSRLNEYWPRQTPLLKPGLWLAALLFALGHLGHFQVARLLVFFPALLFGWAKEKTQGLLCPILLHGSCNLLEMVLRASFVQN
ncbi:MAG: CPBP family intramembrane metalloprotease [Cystobacterineae bacterium]|nr:CPBP family intramembrane metalloprotease [Cystobacterineae bacterium]